MIIHGKMKYNKSGGILFNIGIHFRHACLAFGEPEKFSINKTEKQ